MRRRSSLKQWQRTKASQILGKAAAGQICSKLVESRRRTQERCGSSNVLSSREQTRLPTDEEETKLRRWLGLPTLVLRAFCDSRLFPSRITATITGPRRKTLFAKAARPAACFEDLKYP